MHACSTAPRATVDASGSILEVDAPCAELLNGCTVDLVGLDLSSLGHSPEDEASIRTCLESVATDRLSSHVRARLETPDGNDVYARLVVSPLADGTLTVVVIDETERLEAERRVARLQRRWLSMLRSSTDIVFLSDDRGTLTAVTWAMPDRLGWAHENGEDPLELPVIHPDDHDVTHAAWSDVSAGAHEASLDVRLLHSDESVSWGHLVFRDLREDPDVQSIIALVTDISGDKEQERVRRTEEARFRAHFHQSPLPQVIQTIDGTYADVNDAFCTLLGRSREQLIGVAATAVTHPDDSGEAERTLISLRHGVTEWAQVHRVLMDADGAPVPVRIDATLLRDGAGQPDGCAAALQDLRPLRDSERARALLQDYFDIVAERSSEVVVIFDAEGRSLYASPATERMFGDGYDAAIDDMWRFVHPDERQEVQRRWDAILAGDATSSGRCRVMRADGSWRWVDQTFTNLLDTTVGGIMSSARDVSAQVEAADALRVSEARYRAIAETAEEGILVIGSDGYATYANARLSAIMGLTNEEIMSQPVWAVFDEETAQDVAQRVRERSERGPERYELPYRHPDGSWRSLLIAASPMPVVDGLPQGSLSMISDITEQRRGEGELRHAAEHDELTGLLNRSMLMEHLANPHARGTAVLFIDLDHFKDVNDGRGHTAGDGVLVQVAGRLTSALRPVDVVARFGGDEFVVVLHDVDEDIAMTTARRLLDVLSPTYRIGHHTVGIGASIGIALSPAPTADDLLRFADTAMYAAKASGRGRIRLFDVALAEQAEERYTLGADLLSAIATDGLDMHYQPVVDLATGMVEGVEALARWNHPTRGTIAPSRFVALAELTASAADLDRWVLRRAMQDIAALKADGTMRDSTVVGINLSGQTLAEGLDAYVIETSQEFGIKPDQVSLEITESAIMADKDVAIAVLKRLRHHGFFIAIDDFGTGYSSMAYLRDLPITALKIDRGFVRGIPADAHSLAIVTSLIELARSLDLVVIAEGVETTAHRDALHARGCPLAQGYLWSAAQSPQQLRESGIMRRVFDPAGPA